MKHYLTSLRLMLLALFTCFGLGAWAEEVTMAYSGGVTGNMVADGSNEAATFGLDATQWSVIGDKGANQNAPGLNQANDFRLYWSANGGNTITVASLGGTEITSIALTFTGTNYSNVSVTVDGNLVNGNDGVFPINARSFVLGNANTSNVQVRISKIVITTGGEAPAIDMDKAYEDAMGRIKDGSIYQISTAVGGTTWYLTKEGKITDDKAAATDFTFTQAPSSKGFVPVGWFLGYTFSNPNMDGGGTGTIKNEGFIKIDAKHNREDVERQVLYFDGSKYAIRATNENNTSTWGAFTFWTVIDAELPQAGYTLDATPDFRWTLTEQPKAYQAIAEVPAADVTTAGWPAKFVIPQDKPWTVTFRNGQNIYVTDGTDAILVYAPRSGVNLKKGDTFAGTITGTLKSYNGSVEIAVSKAADAAVEVISEDNEVEPQPLDAATFVANPLAYDCHLVLMEKVNLSEEIPDAASKRNIPATQNGTEFIVRTEFLLPEKAAANVLYDIVGIVVNYVKNDESTPEIYPISISESPASESKEFAFSANRFPGMGYGVTEAQADIAAIKEFLGVEELTTDMLSFVNPDGSTIAWADYIAPTNYDGWCNEEGAAAAWNSTSNMVCIKFFQALEDGTYEICDMNDADQVGKSYTAKWRLVAGDKSAIIATTVTFVEKEAIELTFDQLNQKDAISLEFTSTCGNAYEEFTADVDVPAILAKLGEQSLDGVTIYAVLSDNSLDDMYKLGTTDGWRNADGDWQGWGADARLCVKADFSREAAQIYYIGGMGEQTGQPATYTATYAFVKNGSKDAVVLKVSLTYEEGEPVATKFVDDYTCKGTVEVDIYPNAEGAFNGADSDTFQEAAISALIGEEWGAEYGIGPKEDDKATFTDAYSCDPHPGFWCLADGTADNWSNGTFGVSVIWAEDYSTLNFRAWTKEALTEPLTTTFYFVNEDTKEYVAYNVNLKQLPEDPYEAALALLKNGGTYRIFTEKNGNKYYLNTSGAFVNNEQKAATFTFSKVSKDNTLKEYGFKMEGIAFTNPSLTNGSTGDVVNDGHIHANIGQNRNDWEAQVFFYQDGKFAVRSTNAASENWGANTYWAALEGAEMPEAGYALEPAYDWQIEPYTDERPAAFAKAQELVFKLQATQGLVTDASQWISNAKDPSEGSYEALLDNNYSTFFHSTWHASNDPGEDHYLQANLPAAAKEFYIYFKKRSQNDNNRPTQIDISVSNDGENFAPATSITEGLPTGATPIDFSTKVTLPEASKFVRFTVPTTNNGAKTGDHVFFTFSEFYMLPASELTEAALSYSGISDYTDLSDADVAAINKLDAEIDAAYQQALEAKEVEAMKQEIMAVIERGNALAQDIAKENIPALAAIDVASLSSLTAAKAALAKAKTEVADYFATKQLENANITNGFIVNPTFNGKTGWDGPNFTNIADGVCEYWNASGADFHQVVKLPAGDYKLTAIALTRTGMVGTLYANDNTVAIATVDRESVNDRVGAFNWFAEGNGVNVLEFSLDETTDVTIGLKADNTTADYWTVWQSFKLEMTSKAPAALDMVVNAERYVGLGYGTSEAEADIAAAAKFLGVDAVTTDMLRIVNPDGSMISDYAPYDGWFNGEGVAEKWGDNTKINVKFFEAIPDGKFTICDMNKADELGKTYSVKWALEANGKTVNFTVNVKFVEAPLYKPEIVKTITISHRELAETAYSEEEPAPTFDVAEVCQALGITDISQAKPYVVNVTNGAFVENTTDGWRNAAGDAAPWGTEKGFCIKLDAANGAFDYTGAYDENWKAGNHFVGQWGLVANEKAVLLKVFVMFVNDLNGTDIETEPESPYGYYGDELAEVDTEFGSDYYLYNIGTQQFLTGGNSWGTQASRNEVGTRFTVEALENGTYTLDSHISNGGASHYLGSNGYVDAAAFGFTLTPVADDNEGVSIYTVGDGTNLLVANTENTVVNLAAGNAADPMAQWMLVSKSERLKKLAKATPQNPVDATFMILCSEFGRNDQYKNEWAGGPAIGGNNENMCAEKFNTNFDIYQVVKYIPAGQYEVSVQGFYRAGGFAENTDAQNAFLYANGVETPLIAVATQGADAAGNGYSSQSSNGKFIPNSMGEASTVFSAGAYTDNKLVTTVFDLTMKLGVKKDVTIANDWTIFDSFRIKYLGYDAATTLAAAVKALAEKVAEAENVEETLDSENAALIDAAVKANNKTYNTSWEYAIAVNNIQDAIDKAKAAAGKEDKPIVTGIDAIFAEGNNDIYDLSGRKVSKAQKGIYIVNGKKVAIK